MNPLKTFFTRIARITTNCDSEELAEIGAIRVKPFRLQQFRISAFSVFLFAIFRLPSSIFAADTIITATLTITNPPVAGATLQLSGATYTWGAAGYLKILTNATPAGSTTNLYAKLTNDWNKVFAVSYASASAVTLQANLNSPLAITASTNWASVAFATNSPPNNVAFGASNIIAQKFTLGGTAITNWTDISGGGGSTYTNTPDLPGVITGSGIGTNLTSLVATNQLAALGLWSVNVASFGATAYNTNIVAATGLPGFNGHSLPDATTNIQAALDFAASSGGSNSTVILNAGLYRITTNLTLPSKVKLRGMGILHDGKGGGDIMPTNGWTVIWVDNTNSCGIFVNSGENGSEIHDLEICGWPNPLALMSSYISASPTNFVRGIGVVVSDKNDSNAGGFYDRRLAIHGFNVGMWCQINNVIHDFLDMAGNDVGFVAWNDFTNPTYTTGHYAGVLTNVFNLWDTAKFGVVGENPDNQIFNSPSAGWRAGQIEYLLQGGVGAFTINEEGEQHLTMYGIFAGTQVNINGALVELNQYALSNYWGGTCAGNPLIRPIIKSYYQTRLVLNNAEFRSVATITNCVLMDATDSEFGWEGICNRVTMPVFSEWMGISGVNVMLATGYNNFNLPEFFNCDGYIYEYTWGRFKNVRGKLSSGPMSQIDLNQFGFIDSKAATFGNRLISQEPWGTESYLTYTHKMGNGSLFPPWYISRVLTSDAIPTALFSTNRNVPPPRDYTMDNLNVVSNLVAGTLTATNSTLRGATLIDAGGANVRVTNAAFYADSILSYDYRYGNGIGMADNTGSLYYGQTGLRLSDGTNLYFGNGTMLADGNTRNLYGNGATITNLGQSSLTFTAATNGGAIYPSQVFSNGTYFPNGTLATNSGAAGFLTETGANRKYSRDGSTLTNIGQSSLAFTAATNGGTIAYSQLPYSPGITNGDASTLTNMIAYRINGFPPGVAIPGNTEYSFSLIFNYSVAGVSGTSSAKGMPLPITGPYTIKNWQYGSTTTAIGATNVTFRIYTNNVLALTLPNLLGSSAVTTFTNSVSALNFTPANMTNLFVVGISNNGAATLPAGQYFWTAEVWK